MMWSSSAALAFRTGGAGGLRGAGTTAIHTSYYPYGYGGAYGYGYGYGGVTRMVMDTAYGYGNGGNGYGAEFQSNYGNTSQSRVSELQQRLSRAGYYHGSVDGVLGPQTRRAIRAYEQDHDNAG